MVRAWSCSDGLTPGSRAGSAPLGPALLVAVFAPLAVWRLGRT
jgi:hypothetical protein